MVEETQKTRVRFAHTFSYMAYHSITLDTTLEIEASHDPQEAVDLLQQSYGESMLKVFERYKDNMSDKTLLAYVEARIPADARVAVMRSPFLMDSLLLAAKVRLESEK